MFTAAQQWNGICKHTWHTAHHDTVHAGQLDAALDDNCRTIGAAATVAALDGKDGAHAQGAPVLLFLSGAAGEGDCGAAPPPWAWALDGRPGDCGRSCTAGGWPGAW